MSGFPLSSDDDVDDVKLSSESNCEAKLLNQVALEGIERSSTQTFDPSNMRFPQKLCFSICYTTHDIGH